MSETYVSAKRRRINRALKIKLMIHHQFPGTELASPIYARRHAICCLRPEQKVDVGSTMQACFKIDPEQEKPIGVLMCRLGRMNEFNEDEATCIQLIMIWKIDRFKRFRVVAHLIEHDKGRVWDKAGLMKLAKHYKLTNIQHGLIEETWLIHDNTVLSTRVNIALEEEGYKIETILSETNIKDDTLRPWYFGMDNIRPQPTMKVEIHNQCSDFKLMHGGYFSTGIDWNERPGHRVKSGDIMSVDLTPRLSTFEGILTYEVEKEDREPAYVNLFVTWKSEGHKNFRVFIHLIEHKQSCSWNKVKVEEYCQRYASQLCTYTGPINDTWLMPDGTVLMAKLELNYAQRDGVLNITISEGIRDEHTKGPEWINLESFAKEALNIAVCNLYPDLELTSPVYFNDCTSCHAPPSRQIDTGNTIEASFGIGPKHDSSKGALLYRLQRKHNNGTGNQPNTSTAPMDNTTTNIYLLAIWDIRWYRYGFYVCLLECDSDFTWDEDKLWILHKKCRVFIHHHYESNINTWLMHGSEVMKTKLDVTYGSDYKLNIIISKGARKHKVMRPMKIDPKALLSSSMSDESMYDDSPYIQPSVKLNIYNQCLNIDLVSPTYFISRELECYKPPDYKICSGCITRFAFMITWNRNPHGVLIYKLQKKQTHEYSNISEDTSSAVHLLVVWRIEHNKPFVDVLLVDMAKKSDWNEYYLMGLYRKNSNRFRLCHGSSTELWSLNDNVALMTTSEIIDEDRIVNIIISEVEKYHSARTPIHIDLESHKLQLPTSIIIHNQCLNIELVSSVYFSNGAICSKLFDQQIDINAVMKIRFEINATQDEFEGALLYKLQRKFHDQYNMDILTTRVDKNEAKYVYMFIAWKMKDTKPFVHVVLVEHAGKFVWNEDKLKKLYDENCGWLKEYNDTISDTWFVGDNMALKTTFKAEDMGKNFELSISISEEEVNGYAMRPLCVDLKSLVLQSLISLNIHNQSQSVNLISPVYFTHGGMWYVVPDQEIDADAVTRNYLEFNSGQDISEGALAYRIQEQYIESDKHAQYESKRIQLLVAWRIEHTNGLHVRALLVEHDKEFNWDEDKLRRLYQKYWHLLDAQIDPIKSKWLLNETTVLEIEVKVMSGGYRWDIFISEEKKVENNIERPLWIDAEGLTLHKTWIMTVHNRYPDIELVSSVYYCNCGIYYVYPAEETDNGTMKIGFRLDLNQDESRGILMYEVQRKGDTVSGHQSSIEPIYAKAIEEASKMTRLLVILKIKHIEKPKLNVMLVEYNNGLVLNEYKLAQLYEKANDISFDRDLFEYTWLMCNNTALKIKREVTLATGIELKITISKGSGNQSSIRPMRVDSESLTIRSAIDMTINNQCSNVELSPLVYFTKDVTCHIQFPRQVNPKSIMKANFITGIDRDTFGGALLYCLRWKENISTSTQLLVIWGYKSNETYLHALLIEHESMLFWNEDKLKKLYFVYNSLWHTHFDSGIWLLNDDTKLGLVYKTLCGGFEMEVTISESKSSFHPTEPLWVDPNSLLLHRMFSILVHNQCPNFELVSPVYFGHNAILIRSPDQKAGANTVAKASLGRDVTKCEFTSVLIYKLQRKKRFESNEQSNTDGTFTEDTPKDLQLLIICGSDNKVGLSVRALLIKHNNTITWDEDTLKKLHSMYLVLLDKGLHISYNDISCGYFPVGRETWLLDDVTVLKAILRWKERSHTAEITISEDIKEDDSMEPLVVPSNV